MSRNFSILFGMLIVSGVLAAAVDGQDASSSESALKSSDVSALKLRSIGPALMSGRIADLAIDPVKPNTWYVAVGSGNLWKTVNAGTTWTPIFDNYASYSIGCVTIDPSDRHTIWVGTGENVGGRHVGYGDGVYVSHDGGKSFENTGLKAIRTHFQDRRRSARLRHRLRRGARAAVVVRRRARAVQNDRWWESLDSRS